MADTSETRVKSEGESSKQKDYDPRLDFYSEHFDPLLALRTPGVVPPQANAKEHDNLNAYDSVWNKQVRSGQKKIVKTVESGAVIERKWLPHQCKLEKYRRCKI